MGRGLRAAAVAVAAMAAAGCSSDPAFWEAVAVGLDQAAADLEYENAYCYRGTSSVAPNVQQRYCPGDYGYRDFHIPPQSPYWRERHHGDRGRDDGRSDHGRRGK
ncbi:hypothetical protein [Brevundimonas sp.]|uniref:hypothetical protein n=1 Tax=Brevundimonas sp. TaxID=1871086 RepID=UPI002D71E46D|nr:hypothetical protein [Brevundimonas sp.]HYD27926.1 hypothetical protein [Brevundimonas sp.]